MFKMNAITTLLCCCFIIANFTLVFTKVGFKVKVTTWNVNEKPPVNNIDQLVQLAETPDFYAFTFQEVNPKANPLSKNDERWIGDIKKFMTSKKYDIIDYKSIDGSFTAVFAKNELMSDIKNVATASKRTGKLGLVGNKGATAVRFDYKDTSIIFVGAHFHAHDDQVAARIEDYMNIMNDIRFKQETVKTINDHDVVFWSGDLNFRIDDMSDQQIIEIVKTSSEETVFAKIMSKDQLKKAMKEGKIFKDFVEGKPDFRPTYKYVIGTDNYDSKRKPAYTDRVLYRSNAGNGKYLSYTANGAFKISDHKPVTAFIAIE